VVPPHRIPLTAGWSLWRLAALRGAGLPIDWLDGFAAGDPAEVSEAEARAVSARAVRAIVREPAFVEAVTWQNAALIDNWLGRYATALATGPAAAGEPALSRRDQREALVAFLAQRYCAKNETIGFFGPVAWARFDEGTTGLAVDGTAGVRHRSTYLEHWAARAIADAIAADPAMAPYLTVRLHPAAAVRDGALWRPGRAPLPLDADAGRVAGQLPARAGDLDPAVVARLSDAGLVLTGLPIPIGADPLAALRAVVADLPGGWAKRVEDLGDHLDALHASAGDPVAVRAALAGLDGVFAELSGRPIRRDKPVRAHGRTIAYQDARRDTDVRVGADLLEPLRRPLGLLLDSARWFVAELGAEVDRDLRERHRIRRASTGREVTLVDLILVAGDVLNGLPGTAAHRVADDFHARWVELLRLAAGVPPRLDVTASRRLARSLFPAQETRWRAAVQHSPDLMLAVTDPGPDARWQWVVGELHLALNTLENRPFLTQADDPAELLAATAGDHPAGRLVPLYPPDAPDVTSRTYPPLALDRPDRYTYWSYGRDDGHPTGAPAWPGAGLDVVDLDGRLVVRGPDGHQADVLEYLGEFLTALAVNRFRIRAPAPHLPRLLFDDVVVARESWHVPVGELPTGDADYQQRTLYAWFVGNGLPRRVFARPPSAPKPFLVDVRAPLSLRNLARALRAEPDPTSTVDLVEMLPGPAQTWLTGDDGRHFTTEFRVVAVDEYQVAPVQRQAEEHP